MLKLRELPNLISRRIPVMPEDRYQAVGKLGHRAGGNSVSHQPLWVVGARLVVNYSLL